MIGNRPTQSDIARIVGVSTRTVATVVGTGNPKSGVSAEKRRRIMQVAKELGYRPHRGAQLLKGARTGLIGHIKSVTFVEHQARKSLFLGEAVSELGYDLISVDVLWNRNGLHRALEFLYDSKVEGLLVSEAYRLIPQSKSFDLFRTAAIPIVRFEKGNGRKASGEHAVYADNAQGMHVLMQHLFQQGYERISLVVRANVTHISVHDRMDAYRKAMESSMLKPDVVLVEREERGASLGSDLDIGRRGMERLLRRKRPPEAVCFQNDLYAAGALSLCRDRNISVPGDVAVAGFDDHSVGRFSSPPITSVEQPVHEIARRAATLLVGLFRGTEKRDVPHDIPISFRVHARASTGHLKTGRTPLDTARQSPEPCRATGQNNGKSQKTTGHFVLDHLE